ncbi:hypothetical protein ACFY9C_35220 [Streptomyces filamentosus]|uniref:hypothetical protein n=1 Tax=Streptomyces filamentosus TaxID=67294 RepID=UPI0036E57A31
MHFPRHSTYRVPTKRPPLLAELRAKLASAGDHVRAMPEHGDPTEYEAIADALYQAFVVARNLSPSRDSTNCSSHPRGPVDPEAPDGWGQCLLCNTHRRAGNAAARAGTPKALVQWEVPPPPYTQEALLDRMRLLNDAVFELHLRSSEQEFAKTADLLHGAFVIARELSRPRSASGCTRHPGAPTDPAAAGGPRCLFCVADDLRRQRSATAPRPPQARRGDEPAPITPRRTP